MKKILMLLLITTGTLRASTNQTGTTAAQFFEFSVDSRSEAMGEAYTAISDDVGGLSYNPAGIATADSELQLTHDDWFEGATSEHLSGLVNLGSGTFGLNISYLSIPSQEITERVAYTNNPSQNFITLGSFSPYDVSGIISYGFAISKSLDLGISMKDIAEEIDDSTAEDLAFDLGLKFKTEIEGLDVGMAVQNLGPPSRLEEEAFDLPILGRVGASYQTSSKSMILSADAEMPDDNQAAFAVGVEFNIANELYPRFGYRVDGIMNPWSAGFGFWIGSTKVDFATLPYGALGQIYRASISYDFGYVAPKDETTTSAATVEVVEPKVVLSQQDGKFKISDPQTFISLQPHVDFGESVKEWQFTIFNSRSKIVRVEKGKGPIPSELRWDGTLDAGGKATAGFYWAILSGKYQDGKFVYSNYVKLTLSSLSQ